MEPQEGSGEEPSLLKIPAFQLEEEGSAENDPEAFVSSVGRHPSVLTRETDMNTPLKNIRDGSHLDE